MANPALLVPYFRFRETAIGPIGSEIQIAKADNQRVTLIFTTLTTGSLVVSTQSGFNAGQQGWGLDKATPIELYFRTHPLLVNQDWFVNASGIGPGLYMTVFEVWYYPPGMVPEKGG